MNNVVRQQLWTPKAGRLVGGMVRLSRNVPWTGRCRRNVSMTLFEILPSLRQANPRIRGLPASPRHDALRPNPRPAPCTLSQGLTVGRKSCPAAQ
jgi:hypothetical protein